MSTDIRPSPKANARPSLCLLGRCRVQTYFIGMMKMYKSDAEFNTDVDNTAAYALLHFAPGMMVLISM